MSNLSFFFSNDLLLPSCHSWGFFIHLFPPFIHFLLLLVLGSHLPPSLPFFLPSFLSCFLAFFPSFITPFSSPTFLLSFLPVVFPFLPSYFYLSVCLSVCLSISLSVCPSLYNFFFLHYYLPFPSQLVVEGVSSGHRTQGRIAVDDFLLTAGKCCSWFSRMSDTKGQSSLGALCKRSNFSSEYVRNSESLTSS